MAICPLVTFAVLRMPAQPAAAAPEPVPQVQSSQPVPSSILPEPAPPPSENAVTVAPARPVPLREGFDDTVQASLPWVLVGWMGGVLILSIRLLLGFVGVRRWCWNLGPLPNGLGARVALLSERVGLPGFCRVFVSPHVWGAVALGYLRPMVLLPAAMVTQMPPEMLEAVLAHELAHIRRYDLWVNLAQRVVETLLFYHPAVWWLSNRLRSERELCCDELAVRATRERLTYASALENAGRMRLAARQSTLALGLGQGRKSTLRRVRHILGLPPLPLDSRYWLAGVIAVALLVILAVPAVSVLIASTDKAAQGVNKDVADSGDSGFPRFAARTFNSEMGFDAFVQETPGAGSFRDPFLGLSPRWVGRTPSAVPLKIPACEIWGVQPAAPVTDWDGLVRAIDQTGIPGLQLSSATDSDLSYLARLTRLQHLNLAGSNITDAGLVYLQDLTGLRTLDLSGTRITAAGLIHLQGLTRLRRLDLSGTAGTGGGMGPLEYVIGLQGPLVREDRIVGGGRTEGGVGGPWSDTAVAGSSGWRYPISGSNPHLITDTGMQYLKGLAGLRELSLRNTQISDASLVYLKVLTKLQYLDVRGTQITEAGLGQLQQSLPARIRGDRHMLEAPLP